MLACLSLYSVVIHIADVFVDSQKITGTKIYLWMSLKIGYVKSESKELICTPLLPQY